MQSARQQFLARAALTKYQDGRIGIGYLFDHAANTQHLRISSDDARHRIGLAHCLQASILLLEVVKAKRPIDGQAEQLRLERLGEEIVSPKFDSPQRVGAVVLARENDDLGIWRNGQNLLQQTKTFGS